MQQPKFPINDLGYFLLLIDLALVKENNEQLELEFDDTNSNSDNK
jgi:hypothetical protein